MSDVTDFHKSCRNDYIEMAAKRGQSFLLEEADQCDEASDYLAAMAGDDPRYKLMSRLAKSRADAARKVFAMPASMVIPAARDLKKSRRQQQKGRQQ